MHPPAYAPMALCVESYLPESGRHAVLDFGFSSSSLRRTMTHRSLLESRDCHVTGVDIRAGLDVDVVMDRPYGLPLETKTFDMVMSGQVFEHIPSSRRRCSRSHVCSDQEATAS